MGASRIGSIDIFMAGRCRESLWVRLIAGNLGTLSNKIGELKTIQVFRFEVVARKSHIARVQIACEE